MTRFLHRNVKEGGVMTGRDFYVVCENCGRESKPFHTRKHMPDEPIRKFFSAGGWLLGRNAAHDLCPVCLNVGQENKLARKFKTTKGGEPVPTPQEVAAAAAAERNTIFAKTEDIVARHLGSQEPDPFNEPHNGENEVVQAIRIETGLSLEQTLQLSRSLDGISAALGRLTNEMADVATAMTLLAQENESMRRAVAQIVPAIHKQTEGLASIMQRNAASVAEIADAIIREQQPDAGVIHDAEPGDRRVPVHLAPPQPAFTPPVAQPARDGEASPEAPQPAQAGHPEATPAPAPVVPEQFGPQKRDHMKKAHPMTPQEAGRLGYLKYMASTTPEQRRERAAKAKATQARKRAERKQQESASDHER